MEVLLTEEVEGISTAQAMNVEDLESLYKSEGSGFRVWFVNNTNHSAGNGSFFDPFNTLDAAQTASHAGDVIYVFKGDGTSTGMDMGFVMKDDQKLFGSGASFHLNTSFGMIKVLPKTTDGPLITNSAGNGIDLANNNKVKGIHVDGTSGWGIYGNGIQQANIMNNEITNPASSGGIGIFDSTGKLTIKHNTIQGISSTDQNGIDLENHGSLVMSTVISDNHVSNFLEGIVVFSYDKCEIDSTISSNTVSNTSYSGIDADALIHSYHIMTISNNSVFDNTGRGITSLSTFAAEADVIISENEVTNNGQEGIVIATKSGATIHAVVTHNLAEGNGGLAGILAQTSLIANPLDWLCLNLKNNRSDTGFYFENYPTNTFNLEPLVHNIGTVTTKGVITHVRHGFCE